MGIILENKEAPNAKMLQLKLTPLIQYFHYLFSGSIDFQVVRGATSTHKIQKIYFKHIHYSDKI